MTQSGISAARRQFILSGPSTSKDHRITPLRGDLADIALAGVHFAPHYAVPQLWHCAADYAAIYAEPTDDTAVSELLRGEGFELLDRVAELGWGRSMTDGSVGFIRFDALAKGAGEQTASNAESAQLLTDDSLAAYAESMAGKPYAAGGRGGAGFDAGGLVQQAAKRLGLPHFADLQAVSGGLAPAEQATRGALAFVKDMAAICISESDIIMACRTDGIVTKMALSRLAAAADESNPLLLRKLSR